MTFYLILSVVIIGAISSALIALMVTSPLWFDKRHLKDKIVKSLSLKIVWLDYFLLTFPYFVLFSLTGTINNSVISILLTLIILFIVLKRPTVKPADKIRDRIIKQTIAEREEDKK